MEKLRFENLLARAIEAADPKVGLLYSYEDLQEVLGKLATAARDLAEDNTAMVQRLVRGPTSRSAAPLRSTTPVLTLHAIERSREARMQSLVAARPALATSPSADLPAAPLHLRSP